MRLSALAALRRDREQVGLYILLPLCLVPRLKDFLLALRLPQTLVGGRTD
jgi:hypothetical protein